MSYKLVFLTSNLGGGNSILNFFLSLMNTSLRFTFFRGESVLPFNSLKILRRPDDTERIIPFSNEVFGDKRYAKSVPSYHLATSWLYI